MWRQVLVLGSLILAMPSVRCFAQAEDVLTADEWEAVDAAVERGLKWLAKEQQPDGSFPTMPLGQPAVSGLCEMAFLAHGHLPGEGPYGDKLSRTINYVRGCQKANGLIALIGPRGAEITREIDHQIGAPASYNHAIASLVLTENYAMGGGEMAEYLEPVINRSIQAALVMQRWQKRRDVDEGGWRYVDVFSGEEEDFDSDLSATGWYLMFLRSAKNAGFDVPEKPINEAVGYVRRCFQPKYGAFQLMSTWSDRRSRGMAGAGILALAHAGHHNAPEAKAAGDWLLQHRFNQYNVQEPFDQVGWLNDRYHYGAFNCCQAMYQLGGDYWREFFPSFVKTILAAQHPDGYWQAESHQEDRKYGNAYTTALMLLSLGAPNQLLPVFQR